MIGSPSLKRELERAGLELREGEAGREAEVVAVGGHPGFDYDELRIATQAARRGASLYAAGRDPTFPRPDEPEPHIFEIARSLLPDRRRVAIVGNHLESDIAGGKRAGLTTILVLTGTTSREDLKAAEIEPDVVLDDLCALLRA